jgi:molybdopterin-binding protein/molybdate transport repressor ModE-like protein
MTDRPRTVTDTDIALLRGVAAERSVVAASRAIGISRDRATYRLRRLAVAFGGPMVVAARGGAAHGTSRLTGLGARVARQGFDSVELLDDRPVGRATSANLLRGTYRALPAPTVVLDGGLPLRVSFPAREGERVAVLLEPEAVLVARQRFPSSARNRIPAKVASVRRGRAGVVLVAEAGGVGLRIALTEEAVRQLGLRSGASVWLYVKATALRRAAPPVRRPTPGSRRS